MVGCGENWCFHPWDWISGWILLKVALLGAEGFAGSEVSGDLWG